MAQFSIFDKMYSCRNWEVQLKNFKKKKIREKISRFFRNLQNKWSFYPEGEAKQKFINKTMCENISLKNYPICGFVISDAKCCTGHQPKWFFLQNVC